MVFCVISEFNPFHNGHQYLLHSLPRSGEDYTVCIMSGHFVQRGEPAAYDKWARAAAAVAGGADLVLELPLPYALSDADRFAAKGVSLAAALGLPVTMAFGTEAADLSALERLAAVREEELPIKPYLEQGLSYGAARQAALEQQFSAESVLLRSPNNLLACGYIRACLAEGLQYRGIQRTAAHDGAPEGRYASASHIRRNPAEFDRYCPAPQGTRLDNARAEVGLLTLLRTRTAAELRQTANITEGLENRILTALTETDGLQALYDRVKTKRYAHAKLRRAIACAALGVPAGLPDAPAPYLKVLAFNTRGCGLLKTLRQTAALPVCQSGIECEKISPAFFELERKAADLWHCWAEKPAPCGSEYRQTPIYWE